MNLLLLGSGGREHALAWKISQSSLLNNLFIAPGNAGTTNCGKNIQLDILNFNQIKEFVIDNKVNMVVSGPEEPLVNGIYDFFKLDKYLNEVPLIGPSATAARLEGSKDFAKNFMMKYGIPTANYSTFTKENLTKGIMFLRSHSAPYVLKADGLAAGKGVVICQTLEEAKLELENMLLQEKFGLASTKVVIEEFLTGIELSVFVISDGNNYNILPEAKDYKRVGDDDSGPNTGGMGAISPLPFADREFMDKVKKRIISPTIEGLKKENMEYRGFIFFGLMNCSGEPKVIEYNVRMGDPETEVVIPRIKNDILPLLNAVSTQSLNNTNIYFDSRAAATVMMVSGGYPGNYKKGKIITGLENITESIVFHAGTGIENGNLVTKGGRVLSVTSLAKNQKEALSKSYGSISKISFDSQYYRRDIGKDMEFLVPDS